MLKSGVILICGIIFSVIAGLAAIGAITENRSPQIAIKLKPLNGFAAEKMSLLSIRPTIVANQGEFPSSPDANTYRWARDAFASEPITAGAIAVLALQIGGERKRQLMQEAFKLSRREPLVSAWLVSDSVSQNDLVSVLNYYDTIARTSTASLPVIIPAIASTLENGLFIDPLSTVLARRPGWANAFWEDVLSKPKSMQNAALVREKLFQMGVKTETYRDEGLIGALVRSQYLVSAQRLYTLLRERPAQKINLLQNGRFDTKPAYPPFDWELLSTGEFDAAIADGKLKFSAIQNAGGLFARQLINLPKGIINVEVDLDRAIPAKATMELKIFCAETNGDRSQVAIIPVSRQKFRQKFDNQLEDCRFFWFEILGRTSEKDDGFDIGIESIALKANPVRSSARREIIRRISKIRFTRPLCHSSCTTEIAAGRTVMGKLM